MMTPDRNFEALLLYLKETRGFDFTGLKAIEPHASGRSANGTGWHQRLRRVPRLSAGTPGRVHCPFNTILINVMGFFRDADAWTYLSKEVLPTVLSARPVDAPIRVWSAGCASGEEAYSLAIMLAETMGSKSSANGSRSTLPMSMMRS
jgi:two-component system CheB/CheR fusion protein